MSRLVLTVVMPSISTAAQMATTSVNDFQDSVDRVYMEGVGGMAGLTITGNGTNDVTLAYAGGTITLHGSSLITLGVDDFICSPERS